MESSPSNPPVAPAAAAVKKPLAPGAPPEGQYTRRDFLTLLGWGWLSVALGGWLVASLRFMFPNMLYEPNPLFKAGKPSQYPFDKAGNRAAVFLNWQAAESVWIMSNPEGIYAFSSICTHLGCTPRWVEDAYRFICPCHGSNFNVEGDVIAGPAPIPLWRYAVSLSQDGQLVINKADRTGMKTERRDPKYFLFRNKFA